MRTDQQKLATLLSHINSEVRRRGSESILHDLSSKVRGEIEKTVSPEIVAQGLKKIHAHLLALIPAEQREGLKWPD